MVVLIMNTATLLGKYLSWYGLTHAEFALMANVPRVMISFWARGHRKPGRDYALAIERATVGAVPAESLSHVHDSSSRLRKVKRRVRRVKAA